MLGPQYEWVCLENTTSSGGAIEVTVNHEKVTPGVAYVLATQELSQARLELLDVPHGRGHLLEDVFIPAGVLIPVNIPLTARRPPYRFKLSATKSAAAPAKLLLLVLPPPADNNQ